MEAPRREGILAAYREHSKQFAETACGRPRVDRPRPSDYTSPPR